MNQTNHYDAVIIGFGKGGKTLAAALGNAGKKTALIEKSPLMYGGTCINVGCIPTKFLVSKAKNAKFAKDKDAYYRQSWMTARASFSVPICFARNLTK